MHILFLTPRFPYPPLKGDSLRSYHQIRALTESGEHSVTLLSIAEAPVSASDRAEMEKLCERVEIVPLARWQAALNVAGRALAPQPAQVSYYRSRQVRARLGRLLAEGQFDLVHATLIRVLPYVWGLQHPPVVVDLIDSLTLNLDERRKQVGALMRLPYELEYRRVRSYERRVVRHFPALAVSSEADKQVLGSNHVSVIPNGVDVDHFSFTGQEERPRDMLVFTGNMGYHPNEEAVLWFASEVWPLLRADRPGLRFEIVGTNPTERVRALHVEPGIHVLGRVPDVTEYLHRATLAVCPMRSGSGIQNKVLEAMSAGAGVVATSLANRGVGALPGRDLLTADSAPEFAAAVGRLLDDEASRAKMALSARHYIEEHFRWEAHARRLAAIYSNARSLATGHGILGAQRPAAT